MKNRSILNSKIIKLSVICAFLTAVLIIPAFSFGAEKAENGTEKQFDPKEAIFEHIGDSHLLHTVGKHYFSLPVIVYTDKGLEVFSSGNFFNANHEEVAYAGKNYTYLLEKDKVKIADASGKVDASKKIYDFSITRNVASMWFGMLLLLIIFFTVAGSYKKRVGKAPKGLQSFMEPLILFIRDDVAIPNIGIKYVRYMSLLLTIFFFILINNLLGLVPFFPWRL